MKKISSLLVLLLALLLPATMVNAASRVPYNWHQLKIGGQGFITGIVCHPTEPNLVYVRTDVGGCYRWNEETEDWTQLCDKFPRDNNHMGIDGIAIDPNDPDVVYIATGSYIHQKGDILKSTDRGETWTETGLNKAFASNTSRRDFGECIQVDPNNSKIIVVGTRKDGLYISDNGAKSWNKVGTIDYPNKEGNPPRVVHFDASDVKDGRTQTIYVGVSNYGLLVTHDAGETWTKMEAPFVTVERMAVKDGVAFFATDKGAFKYENGQFVDITPPQMAGVTAMAIDVDPRDINRIIVDRDGLNSTIYMTTDGGQTWTDKIATGKYDRRLPWDGQEDNYSFNNHDMRFDCTNPGRVWTTGFMGVFKTDDIDQQPTQHWSDYLGGIEEVVPRDATTFPDGKYRLMTAIADIDGFVFSDIYDYPDRMIRSGNRIDPPTYTWMMGSTQLDFCEENPDILLRPGIDWNAHGKLEYSLDRSETWINLPDIRYYVDKDGNPTHRVEFGRAAVGAQLHPETGAPAFVILNAYSINDNQKLPEGQHTVPLVSIDYGKTWTECKGFPEDFNSIKGYWDKYIPLASDRVNGAKFYMYSQNNVYVSDDYGYNWRKTTQLNGNWYESEIRTAPGMEGEVWVSLADQGVFRSSDGAQSFTKIDAVGECAAVGFGKGAPGFDNPATYVLGKVDGVWGAFRSDDMGETWVRLNDDNTTLNAANYVISGDRQTYGLVYIASEGRGFYVGVPKGVDVNEGREQYLGGGDTEEDDKAIYSVYYDGQEVKFLDIPVVRNGTVYVPVRDLFDYYRFDMTWDNDTQSLIANRPELDVWNAGTYFKAAKDISSVKFTMDSNVAVVDGENQTMSAAAVRINERMYIPVSTIVDVLGNQIKIDKEKKTVDVYDTKFILNQELNW